MSDAYKVSLPEDVFTQGGCFFLAGFLEWWKTLNESQRLAVLDILETDLGRQPADQRLDMGR